MTYSQRELESAEKGVLHNIYQLFGYYAWMAKIAPCLDQRVPGARDNVYFLLAQNAVIDGFLINLRRLNEFFSSQPEPTKPDDLRAYHFGFCKSGRFLNEKDMIELHKRVGHSTVHGARFGDVSCEAHCATELALERSHEFLEYLSKEFHTLGTPESEEIAKMRIHLRDLWESWSREAQASCPRPSQKEGN